VENLPYGIRLCYLQPDTGERAPALTPARQVGTRLTYPGGMEGCVYLKEWQMSQWGKNR